MKAVLDKTLYIPVPYLFNVPYMPLQSLVSYFNISDCNQWYMYDFDKDAPADTREFWGENAGTPMLRPESYGILNGRKNILEYPCKAINRTVPYFEELDRDKYLSN